MKKKILILFATATALSMSAQITEEVVDDNDLFAPFRTVYRNVEHIDFSIPAERRAGTILKHHVASKHDMMNDRYYDALLVPTGRKYIDVVTTTRRNGGISISSDNSTVRTGTRHRGMSTSDRNMSSRRAQVNRQAAFAAARREAMREARREAARREYERKVRERAIDNRRAEQAQAQAHARLQGITDARIARDYHNATIGAAQARETSQSTANSLMRGPRIMARTKPRPRTGAMTAEQLRQGIAARRRKPRVLYRAPKAQSVNSLTRPQPAVVRVKPGKNGEYVFTGRMTRTSIHIKPDPRFGTPDPHSAPRTIAKNEGFRLSPHAVVTTGKPVSIVEYKQKEIPPRKPEIKGMTPEEREEMHRIMYEEFFPDTYDNSAKS